MKPLQIATYNILASLHPDEIVLTIKQMAEGGVMCFCLQEVVQYSGRPFIGDTLLALLGSNWQTKLHIGSESGRMSNGTMILWNTEYLQLLEERLFEVRPVKTLAPHEYLFTFLGSGRKPRISKRRMISCRFTYFQKEIRITDIHLEHVGGAAHRREQLKHILHMLHTWKDDVYEIFCGDFNTFDLRRSGGEYEGLQQVFGKDVVDVSKDSGSTADLFDVDLSHSIFIFRWVIRTFHIHIRRKLDYIWVRGMKAWTCQKLGVKGSDHKPLAAKLTLE